MAASPQIKKGAADAAGCVEGLRKKVLRMDGPWTHLRCEGSEGGGIALRAMSIKSALRIYLSASYGMKNILLTGSLRSPPPIRLRRTSPCSGGRIKL